MKIISAFISPSFFSLKSKPLDKFHEDAGERTPRWMTTACLQPQFPAYEATLLNVIFFHDHT
jgi:hypothetical protein